MTGAEIRAALEAAYSLIESVEWDSPAFEDEVVVPAHAKIETLLYGDAAIDPAAVLITEAELAQALRLPLDEHQLMTTPAECSCGGWSFRDEPRIYFDTHQCDVIAAAILAAHREGTR
jgi:hypothetical protein